MTKNGLDKDDFFPEFLRALATSSWTCSAEVRSDPARNLRKVAACAFSSRAEQFVAVPSLCFYFCQLAKAKAHITKFGDTDIDEANGMRLGVAAVTSVRRAIRTLSGDAAMATETEATQNLLATV